MIRRSGFPFAKVMNEMYRSYVCTGNVYNGNRNYKHLFVGSFEGECLGNGYRCRGASLCRPSHCRRLRDFEGGGRGRAGRGATSAFTIKLLGSFVGRGLSKGVSGLHACSLSGLESSSGCNSYSVRETPVIETVVTLTFTSA